ncbi:hypothetical protein DL98DRAFT_641289 [Cadophora sp. DSE1049]|nr:hypothetical protein DL98DRAFT_641289 [Cadophora sp. DSE1049]
MEFNTPPGHSALLDSPPMTAGHPGEFTSTFLQPAFNGHQNFFDEPSKNAGMIDDVKVTRSAPDNENQQMGEAVFQTGPLVVNGSMGKRETPRVMGHRGILLLPETLVAPAMVRSSGFYGFPNGHPQNYASYQQPAMQYQHPYGHPAPAQPLPDSVINHQYAQELNRRERQLLEVQQDNHNLCEQIENFNNGMATQTDENEGLNESIRQITAINEALGITNSEMKEQVEEISIEKNKLDSSLGPKGTVIENLSNANRQKEEQLKELSTEKEELNALLHQKRMLIERQWFKNSQQEQQITDLRAANTDLQKTVDELNLRVGTAEAFFNRILQSSRSVEIKLRQQCMQRGYETDALLMQRQVQINQLQSCLEIVGADYEGYISEVEHLMYKQEREIDVLTETNKDFAAALDITMRAAKEESDKYDLREKKLKADIESLLTNLHDTVEALHAATSHNRVKEQELEELMTKFNKKTKENESRSKRQARMNATELNQKLIRELEAEKNKSRAAELEKIEWQRKFQEANNRQVMVGQGTYLRNMGIFLLLVVVFFNGLQASAAHVYDFEGVFVTLVMQISLHQL